MDDPAGLMLPLLAAVLLVLERMPGLQAASAPIRRRWASNIGLLLLGGILVTILFPGNVLVVAANLPDGLVRNLGLPLLAEALLAFLVLDCLAYWQHRLFHEISPLWRVHLVHHSDTSMDITTGQRHHPLESVLSVLIGFFLLFALGFSVLALGASLLISQLAALYTHANIRLPERLDRILRRIVVTPSVHVIHHSSLPSETDSNYGTVLTIWDRLFGTYTDPAVARLPALGLEYFRDTDDELLPQIMLQPFRYSRALNQNPLRRPHASEVDVKPGLSPAWSKALAIAGIGVLLTTAALWPAVVHLAGLWRGAQAYQYAWLVIPVFIYAGFFFHRERTLALVPAPGFSGSGLFFAAAVVWLLSYPADIKLGMHLALALSLQGVALCALGIRVYRKLLPLMLFLFLLVPCGDLMQPLLKDLTVKWIEWYAIAFGLPHVIEGYYAMVGEHEYMVVNACSGLPFFTLGAFLGYSFGLLLFHSLKPVVALAALGAALGIATNAMRIWLIVAVDQIRGTQMDIAGHTDIQWLVWFASLALLLYLTVRFTPRGQAVPAELN